MSSFSAPSGLLDQPTRRRRTPINTPPATGTPTYLSQPPIYGDTSRPTPSSVGMANPLPAAVTGGGQPAMPPQPSMLRQQNAGLMPRGPSNPTAVMNNAIQARSNAIYATAAPSPAASPSPGTPGGATGQIQFTEQQAREMLHSMGAVRPGMTLEQLRPEWTQTLGKYGIDPQTAGGLWDRWSMEGSLGKADYPAGQTVQPAQAQAVIPPNPQTGQGGVAALPSGAQVVVNANGQRVGNPIGQGAPPPPTVVQNYGPQPGYTPLPTGIPSMGGYVQGASPPPTTQPGVPSAVMSPNGANGKPLNFNPTAPQANASQPTAVGGQYAQAARTAYIGRQNDRADMLSGGYYSNRENTSQLVGAEANALNAGAADAKQLRTQNTSLQNQLTRTQNSNTLAAGRTGDAQRQKYYESRISRARENLHSIAGAAVDPSDPQIAQARKELNDAHADYESWLSDHTGMNGGGAAGGAAPTTQPTATGQQPTTQPAQQGEQRRVVRTGSYQGKSVVMYADGTVAFQ